MTPDRVPYPLLKSITDKALSALMLVLVSPVALGALATIAVNMLIKPRDRGPVLYRERRISRGREFDLLKFRTLRAEVLAGLGDGHARPLEADAENLTWAGGVLKRWYLDELPQLVNILRGDMSLVGPRPWPLAMVAEQVASGADYRNLVQAGWTGPAQITKGTAAPVRYAALDLVYVEACRTLRPDRLVRLDLGILARTVAVVVRGQGLSY